MAQGRGELFLFVLDVDRNQGKSSVYRVVFLRNGEDPGFGGPDTVESRPPRESPLEITGIIDVKKEVTGLPVHVGFMHFKSPDKGWFLRTLWVERE